MNDLNEDIKILEEYINCGFNENDEIRAIENLLKRYKELEEENIEWRGKYLIELNRQQYFIPISVIQNKIMNLNLEIEKLQIEYEKEVVNAYKQVNLGKQTMLSEKVKLLQELLEERE